MHVPDIVLEKVANGLRDNSHRYRKWGDFFRAVCKKVFSLHRDKIPGGPDQFIAEMKVAYGITKPKKAQVAKQPKSITKSLQTKEDPLFAEGKRFSFIVH